MGNRSSGETLTEEEKLVAELELLGIRYLSRQSSYRADQVRSPEVLLADLIRQPSARVRAAVIAVMLSHPEYAGDVSAALKRLRPPERLTLQAFYLAAVLLQQEYAHRFRPLLTSRWRWLPELQETKEELRMPAKGTPHERLVELGREHRRLTQTAVNWTGTFEQAARQLLRQLEKETQWEQ